MSLMRWNPTKGLLEMKDDWDKLVGDFFTPNLSALQGQLTPPINAEETENEFIITAELPGMSKKDVQITFQEGTLTIFGEKKSEKEFKEGSFHRFERQFGTFNRSFTLPRTVVADKITADFKDGILTIHLPKVEEAKPKKIEVKVQ